ncbi:hypothetical protein, partial [Burkholderia vietnamiensis]|uniref:hypothetical protein n=1 Tax=Burkholderia vietnamiensis TaxID=60552 RepID=UPI002652325B
PATLARAGAGRRDGCGVREAEALSARSPAGERNDRRCGVVPLGSITTPSALPAAYSTARSHLRSGRFTLMSDSRCRRSRCGTPRSVEQVSSC